MSEYYTLHKPAGLEALYDMQLDTVFAIHDYIGEMIIEIEDSISECDISGIPTQSAKIAQQLEYARDVISDSSRITPEMEKELSTMINNIDSRFHRSIGSQNLNARCILEHR